MEKTKKWVLRTLLIIGMLNVIGIIIGLLTDSMVITLVMTLNAVVMGLLYNTASKSQ
jgi:predicted Co/Zn/Cd cation transporter (cation efflux family)